MPKRIEVTLPDGGTSYFVSFEAARRMTALGQAKWDGGNDRIVREVDASKKAAWEPKKSGRCGPLVLQLI